MSLMYKNKEIGGSQNIDSVVTPDSNNAVSSKAVYDAISEINNETIDLSEYAKITDIPTSLPANGGNADTVNNHTVESDVPSNAIFTDTVYNDTDVVNRLTLIENDYLTTDDKTELTTSIANTLESATNSANTALASAKTYTDNRFDEVMGEGASETLDTIGEISKAFEENQEVVDTLNSAIGNKVDKVSGKELSTNDLTNALKSNYDTAYTHSQSSHAPADAEKNVIVGIKKNGEYLGVATTTRSVDIEVPTKLSELENDVGFKTTDTDTNTTYTLSKTGSLISLIGSDGRTTNVTDSNTTYTLESFGVTVTSDELNCCDGVTDNIQTQIDDLKKSVADGKELLASTISDYWGKTVASDATFSELSSAIDGMYDVVKAQGYSDGYKDGVATGTIYHTIFNLTSASAINTEYASITALYTAITEAKKYDFYTINLYAYLENYSNYKQYYCYRSWEKTSAPTTFSCACPRPDGAQGEWYMVSLHGLSTIAPKAMLYNYSTSDLIVEIEVMGWNNSTYVQDSSITGGTETEASIIEHPTG